MATHRLLFAINHKKTEDGLRALLQGDFVCAEAVTYKEAILPALANGQYDTLLLIDNLGGSIKMEDLISQIRLEFPMVRIVFIAVDRHKGDAILSMLVSYGIYDIIVSESVTLNTIVHYLREPHNFSDVAQYFIHVESPKSENTEPEQKPKRSFFQSLFGVPAASQSTPAKPVEQDSAGQSVNVEALRAALAEEANKKAQAGIEDIIKAEVEKVTAELTAELNETQKALTAAESALQEKLASETAASKKISDLKVELSSLQAKHKQDMEEAETIRETYEKQLKESNETVDPEWFKKRSAEWEEEKARLDGIISDQAARLQALSEKTHEMETRLEQKGEPLLVDLTDRESGLVIPDDMEYEPSSQTENHIFLFVGAKHGLGNSTTALNVAAQLAATGKKTLLMELNGAYPMVNQYFEFTGISCGIDTACACIESGRPRSIEAAVIKPHGLTPPRRALGKVYRQLPGSLHFMLFSNSYLLACSKGEQKKMSADTLKGLIYTLAMQLKYSYVVIDAQFDNNEYMEACLSSGMIDKLVISMDQSPHAIASAGLLISNLARINRDLVKSCKCVVCRYVDAGMDIRGISKTLRMDSGHFSTLRMDWPGHLSAARSGLPYVFNGGQETQAYHDLMTAIL